MDMIGFWLVTVFTVTVLIRVKCQPTGYWPQRILIDTDADTDDFFALLYILKLNRSEIDLKAITINSNAWSNAGHAINHFYDILYMMDRDDIPIGVGGEGGILDDGTILPNVGGYLPIIEQGMTTVGGCRYRQAIPKGGGGRLDVDTNYGIRRAFLPQGKRKYTPIHQPTAQEVMLETISAGPTTVFLIGAHTNVAIFIMKNPHLKGNIRHIYIMGGGVRSSNPTGCCPKNTTSCKPEQCGDRGNLYTDYTSNPYAEFNVFGDPFAAYQVLHSGIPITLVPIDATNTIPITSNFFKEFERHQMTYEAQYCFQSLKIAHDTWFDDQFFTSYFMWDSFTSGIAASIMQNPFGGDGENEFAEMELMNITVVTSNKPYGASDGSNPFFDGHPIPKFDLDRDGVHSGHVQTGLRDPFCFSENGKGKCQDGYTEEVTGTDSVQVLVAKKAKPSTGILDLAFYKNFLDTLNCPEQSGKRRFGSTGRIPYERKPSCNHGNMGRGRPIIFDMDMSAGDFLSLILLLKVPVEVIDLKAVLVTPTGWANAATLDVIYDVLHMMGRDDIPVGLGGVYAMDQRDSVFSGVGGCKYVEAIPQGAGGFLDSDTLYGLARSLPRSPRRYTAENSVEKGAPRNTDHPELRQALAGEVWESVVGGLPPGSKISLLTSGPLTTIATILSSSHTNYASSIQDVFILGGHIPQDEADRGNVYTVPSNRFAEFNMFLDPLAAKSVFGSGIRPTLIPLRPQRTVTSFRDVILRLRHEPKTPEAVFSTRLLSLLNRLRHSHPSYAHVGNFMGELLGATFFACEGVLDPVLETLKLRVIVSDIENADGEIVADDRAGIEVRVLKAVNISRHYDVAAALLGRSFSSLHP